MSRDLKRFPSSWVLARTIILALTALASYSSSFAQQQQEDPTTPASNLSQKPSAHGNFSRPSCDTSDPQSLDCDNPSTDNSAPAATRKPSPGRSNEIPQALPLDRFPKSTSLEDSQYQRTIDPPTEFQKFVEDSVGKKLPIYGASLFERPPSTYAPVDRVPVGGDYQLGPGDELDVRVWGQINFEQKLTMDRNGAIFIPQVGIVNLSGIAFDAVPAALKGSIGRVFRNFDVSVSLGKLRSIQVFVMGHARRPGTYTVSSLSTLVNALFISGGPAPQGSMRNIELKRAGQTVTRFDMYDLLLHGDKTKDITLKPGDVIFIPSAGPRIAVAGSVEIPAIYEIKEDSTLRQVLSDAGGLSPVAAGQHAVLERIDDHSTLASENIPLNQSGLATTLQNGDIVRLLNVVPRYTKTVSLKGNVADPVRLPWHEGMRVTDLIPEKRALLTRNYWAEHNRLTSNSGDYTEETQTNIPNRDPSVISSDRTVKARKFLQKNDFQRPAPDINWSYASIERLDEQTLTTRLIPFNLGKAVIEHDDSANLQLQPGDIINVFSLADFTAPVAEQSRIVRLEGEVRMAGIYSVRPGETLRQLVERAGGLTDKAYLYASMFTRQSTKKEQQKQLDDYLNRTQRELDQNSATLAARTINAEQQASFRADLQRQKDSLDQLRNTQSTGRIVLDIKPDSHTTADLPDLTLEDGDRLIVPDLPITVSVIGTVFNQSTFVFTPDSSVRDYLKLSGGPTKYADPSQMFVLRADGSVVSRAKLSHFESIAVRPGDAVVVPPNALKVSKVRNVLDWSQVLSSFGIAAAAINVLR